MRILLFWMGLLVAGSALAEPDSFGLGTGRNGNLRVDTPDTIVNHYGQLFATVAAGDRDLTVSNAGAFVAGELVLLHQSSGGLQPMPFSGDQRYFDLNAAITGRFEYARVEAVGPSLLRLTAPLQYSYVAGGGTQVVSVPEYTSVEVAAGGSLKAAPWDGSVGGILALLATGTLTNDGLITVEQAGFRGGPFINQPDLYDCTMLDLFVRTGGAFKGEGLVTGYFGFAAGRGNLANGGGGGNCHAAGGGGGSHAGTGGQGGYTVNTSGNTSAVGGYGGAPLLYRPYEHLVFGGGGGAGAGHLDFGTAGGSGGGALLIRAGAVTGTGRFSATAASADSVPATVDDAAGGGGAGGALSVRAVRGLGCGLAQALGGAGGDTRNPTRVSGPGGGGGGGVVFLQGESITCPVSVSAGHPGQATAVSSTYGAGPSQVDRGPSHGSEQKVLKPFRVPTTPALTEPGDGATVLSRQPLIYGTAEPGIAVHLFLDGVPYVRLVSDNAGEFSYTPATRLSLGSHELRASAEEFGSYSPLSPPHRFEVVTPSDGGSSMQAPILVVPTEGAQVEAMPLFAGTSSGGAAVGIEVDGTEVARVPLDDQRRFHYTLTAEQQLAPGAHTALARAWDEAGVEGLASPTTHFEVKPAPESAPGRGCSASPGAGLGAVALLLCLGSARLRR